MTTIVTVLLYSGRSNPTWELTEEQTATLKKLLGERKEATFEMSAASAGLLGYTGFQLQSYQPEIPSTLFCFDGIIDVIDQSHLNFIDRDSSLEKFLLDSGANTLDDLERKVIRSEIEKNSEGGPGSVKRLLQETLEALVPPYDPGKWNIPSVHPRNNCYNYANDKITNTFAQPGRGSGSTIVDWTCATVAPAAQRDGQIPVSAASGTPADGHYIALVSSDIIRDYHWYRLDANGRWSHKPGQTAATNLDNAGRTITDPRTCNRGYYTNFCGFFHCIPARTRIR